MTLEEHCIISVDYDGNFCGSGNISSEPEVRISMTQGQCPDVHHLELHPVMNLKRTAMQVR